MRLVKELPQEQAGNLDQECERCCTKAMMALWTGSSAVSALKKILLWLRLSNLISSTSFFDFCIAAVKSRAMSAMKGNSFSAYSTRNGTNPGLMWDRGDACFWSFGSLPKIS